MSSVSRSASAYSASSARTVAAKVHHLGRVRHAVGVDAGDETRRRSRSASRVPVSAAEQGRLAGSARAGDGGDRAGGEGRAGGAAGQRPCRPGNRTVSRSYAGGRVPESASASGPASRAASRMLPQRRASVLRRVEGGAEIAQPGEALRGEQQGDEGGDQGHVAGEQADAEQHGDDRDRQGREQFQRQRGQERRAQSALGAAR